MELSDAEAVRATLQDRNAFGILVKRYQMPLLRYIQRIGNIDREVAEDILQEAFIKIYTNLNDFDPSFAFASWAYRIAHNETMRFFRKQKNKPRVVTDESELELFTTIPAELDIPGDIDSTTRAGLLAKGVQRLKPQYRDVVILRFFEGKSYDEISDILQIPSGTVATHIARGKADLRTILKEFGITDVYYGIHG
jgi:RNA polymerase sigma-70 factor (ECF subfamily)